MFIFKYKEICIYDHYAPFTPSVTPDKTTFMFLPVSSTQDITSGFFQYGNSASSAALPRSTFSKIIHNARQIWAWPSHLLSERTAGPSERHKWLWIIQLVKFLIIPFFNIPSLPRRNYGNLGDTCLNTCLRSDKGAGTLRLVKRQQSKLASWKSVRKM